ncbi:MAG: hypothetical protein ABSG30_10035 [Steroidobacteraceae bacterium]|jgi:hypothetical protein
MATNLYAPPKAQVADIVHGEAAPALWNPGAAASWSVLLSPAFGAFLHMKNWEALGESDKAAAARKWVVIYLVTVVGLSVVAAFLPSNNAIPGLVRLSGFVLLISWYYASGKSQVDFVKSRYGKQYPRKGWAQPLLIAMGTIVGFIFLVGAIAASAALFLRRS